MSTGAPYTQEQLEWLRVNYRFVGGNALAEAFNARFGQNRTAVAIKGTLFRNGIHSGRTGRFEPGHTTWNKDKRCYMGANATSFKPGNIPANRKRLWTERINRDGYIEINIPERNPWTGFPCRWKAKHLWLWETVNGPLPTGGYAVIFRDGNNRNFDHDNLLLVTRAELLALNLHGYQQYPDELKPSVLALARIEAKAGFRLCPSRGRNSISNQHNTA